MGGIQVENDVERLRVTVKQWTNSKPPKHVLSLLDKKDEGCTLTPNPRVQQKACHVISSIRNQGLKDYHRRKREYNLNRHPTPPPPQLSKLTAHGRAGKRHQEYMGEKEPTTTDQHKSKENSQKQQNTIVPMQCELGDVHFHKSSERQTSGAPKQLLRKDISNAESKIVIYRCGGTLKGKEEPPFKPDPYPKEIIVVSSKLPQYNGTYLFISSNTSWINGCKRIIKHDGRWRIEDSDYSWIESGTPHFGKPPSACVRWDFWNTASSAWEYDPTLRLVPISDNSFQLFSNETSHYEGEYFKSRYLIADLPVWESQTCILCSHDGYWIVNEKDYTYAETRIPYNTKHPSTAMQWDMWMVMDQKWKSCKVNIIYKNKIPPPRQRRVRRTIFVTQNGDEGTSDSDGDEDATLSAHVPTVQLPNFTINDILSGRATAKEDAVETDLDDEKRELTRIVEGLLFGFTNHMKLQDAQRALGITYRFTDQESSLTPIPYDFGKFASLYGKEKAQFHHRCIKEIRRMANQREALFRKKRRILSDILKNDSETKSVNPRWRHANENMQRRIFTDIEKEFKAKRRSLLRRWLENFRSALPPYPVQGPGCRAILAYLEGVFEAPDLRLNRESFYSLCYDILPSHHFLLSDVIGLLWCAKRIFQVSDDQFCEMVRSRTKVLYEYNFNVVLPPVKDKADPLEDDYHHNKRDEGGEEREREDDVLDKDRTASEDGENKVPVLPAL